MYLGISEAVIGKGGHKIFIIIFPSRRDKFVPRLYPSQRRHIERAVLIQHFSVLNNDALPALHFFRQAQAADSRYILAEIHYRHARLGPKNAYRLIGFMHGYRLGGIGAHYPQTRRVLYRQFFLPAFKALVVHHAVIKVGFNNGSAACFPFITAGMQPFYAAVRERQLYGGA